MSYSVKYTGTKPEKLEKALADCKDYLGEEKLNQVVEYLNQYYLNYGIKRTIMQARMFCMVAGISGLPVKAIIRASVDLFPESPEEINYVL